MIFSRFVLCLSVALFGKDILQVFLSKINCPEVRRGGQADYKLQDTPLDRFKKRVVPPRVCPAGFRLPTGHLPRLPLPDHTAASGRHLPSETSLTRYFRMPVREKGVIWVHLTNLLGGIWLTGDTESHRPSLKQDPSSGRLKKK